MSFESPGLKVHGHSVPGVGNIPTNQSPKINASFAQHSGKTCAINLISLYISLK